MPLARTAALVLFALLVTPAWGWDRVAHALIATIAQRHLSPQARAEVAKLLGRRSNLVGIASWADDVRPRRSDTFTWHFINIPLEAAGGDWHAYCPASGCLPGQAVAMAERLRDATRPPAERAEALRFLVHFIGDLHQPLHVGERGDRGGNDIAVIYFGHSTELHSTWDSELLKTALNRDHRLKRRLTARATPDELAREAAGDVALWLWQSRDLSRDLVYRQLPAERPAVLREAYFNAAEPAVELQIRRAGLRLAVVLNQSLSER